MIVAKEYLVNLECEKAATFGSWKGRIIRGTLGRTLKILSCKYSNPQKRKDELCKTCKFLSNCAYGYIYRNFSKGIVLRKSKYFPAPYSIKPELSRKKEYKKGDTFSFSITLFGDALLFERELLNALIRAFKVFGSRAKQGSFRVKSIYLVNRFKNKKEVLYEDNSFYQASLHISLKDLIKIKIGKTLKIKFLTPVRFVRKIDDKEVFLTSVSFYDFISFSLHKYTSILAQYLGIPPNESYVNKVIEESKKVATLRENFKEVIFDYSKEEDTEKSKKKKEEEFLTGEAIYKMRSNRSIFKKVISFALLSNVGKRTTFGHGWFTIS